MHQRCDNPLKPNFGQNPFITAAPAKERQTDDSHVRAAAAARLRYCRAYYTPRRRKQRSSAQRTMRQPFRNARANDVCHISRTG